jgi:hypothetical protein
MLPRSDCAKHGTEMANASAASTMTINRLIPIPALPKNHACNLDRAGPIVILSRTARSRPIMGRLLVELPGKS